MDEGRMDARKEGRRELIMCTYIFNLTRRCGSEWPLNEWLKREPNRTEVSQVMFIIMG